MTFLVFFLGFLSGAIVAGALVYVWLVLMFHKESQ